MQVWKPLNMELRSWVISHILRLEQMTKEIVKIILKIADSDSKTLGHKSSALSFKNRVDLLLDLKELGTIEYKHMIKLLEIRNQFAHNSDATSFEEFDNINPLINKYLLKHLPEKINEELSKEQKLQAAFTELFRIASKRLMKIHIEYSSGFGSEVQKYLNSQAIENIDAIWELVLEKFEKDKIPTTLPHVKEDIRLRTIYTVLKSSISEFIVSHIKSLEANERSVIRQKFYKQKVVIKDDHIEFLLDSIDGTELEKVEKIYIGLPGVDYLKV